MEIVLRVYAIVVVEGTNALARGYRLKGASLKANQIAFTIRVAVAVSFAQTEGKRLCGLPIRALVRQRLVVVAVVHFKCSHDVIGVVAIVRVVAGHHTLASRNGKECGGAAQEAFQLTGAFAIVVAISLTLENNINNTKTTYSKQRVRMLIHSLDRRKMHCRPTVFSKPSFYSLFATETH